MEITEMNDDELTELITAVTRRFSELHPGHELIALSLPKEPLEREKAVERTAECMMIWNKP